MIKHFSSLCSFSPSSLSSILPISFLLGRKRHCFLLLIITVFHIIPGHWVTVTKARREVGIIPHGAWDIFKGRAHAHITRLGNWVIPGHFVIIPGHFWWCIPGHCVCFFCDMGLSRRNTRWLVVVVIMDPQKAALM